MQGTMNDLSHSDLQWDGWRQVEKTITFAGGTTNAIGDHDGTNDPFDIFTLTGDVKVKLMAVCTTSLTGDSATLEVGVTGSTASLIALTTATDITAGDVWHDNAPDAPIELSSVVKEYIIANGNDIIGTVKTANITAGVIRFVVMWKPIDRTGLVVAA